MRQADGDSSVFGYLHGPEKRCQTLGALAGGARSQALRVRSPHPPPPLLLYMLSQPLPPQCIFSLTSPDTKSCARIERNSSARLTP